jgi:hypothetical protein
MRGVGRVIRLVLVITVWLILLLVYPLLTLLVSVSTFVLLTVLRQLNLYKIVMLIKRAFKDVSKLRYEVRAKLNLGFRDSRRSSLDGDEEFHQGKYGYIR